MVRTADHSGFLDRLRSVRHWSAPMDGNLANSAGLALILAAGYFLLGRFAFFMAISEGSATSVAFLPEGMALVFTVLFGSRVSLGIFVGQLALSVSLGNPMAVGAAFGFTNMVGGCAGSWLFWKWRISPAFNSPGDITKLLVLSALVIQPFSALFRVSLQVAVTNTNGIFHLLFYSWAGNIMGQLLFVPLFLSWCYAGFRFDWVELKRSLVILLVYGIGILLFVALNLGEVDRIHWSMIFIWFYLILNWIAMKSGALVTALSCFLSTMGFLWVIAASPDFSTQDRVLYADMLIFGGVATSQIIASLFSQLRKKTAQLIQANHAKECLLAIVGHDLRSPIVSFSAALDLVKTGRMKQKEFASLQEHLRLVTNHTLWTLENTMEWATLQLGELKSTPGSCRVRSMIQDTLELLRVTAESKGIDVTIDVDVDIAVWADRHQLSSILRNLLSNAIKFTSRGGSVKVSAVRLERYWLLSVQDNGVGMVPQLVERLFEDDRGFFPSVGTAHERGTGLGLRIVSSFVKANGGSLTVESVENKGSIFHFTLPMPPANPS